MNFEDLVSRLFTDTMQISLAHFGPELAIVGTILILLLARLVGFDRYFPGSLIALTGTLWVTTLASNEFWEAYRGLPQAGPLPLFTGLLVWDGMTAFFKVFLGLFLLFLVYLTTLSGIPDQEDAPDFYVLLLGSTLGMMLMVSANHLLMVFLAVEITSVPSYAMVGFLKGRRMSSEAALKYVVYGAGAAGVMLYGISLLAGIVGSGDFTGIAQKLVEFGHPYQGLGDRPIAALVFAILTILVGISFKLSVVPFHFWCPDAFEGAAAEVGAFLSVASKAAAFGLLLRICLALVGSAPLSEPVMSNLYLGMGVGLGIIAAVTATFGNLAAYAQTNIKRLLAYSTIAHAGYMLMAVSALMVVLNGQTAQGTWSHAQRIEAASRCVEGLLYYLCVYFFMNLGAFAVVALVRNRIFSEEIADYSGLIKQSPVLAISMLLCMFSLVGMPPFGGFFGKFVIFASLWNAGHIHWVMWVVLVIAGFNTVFSLVYYVRVLRYMFLADVLPNARPVAVPASSEAGRYVLLTSIPVLLLGIFVEPISQVARDVARQLF